MSVSCFGELHTLPCSVCLMFSCRMHKAWKRGGEISFLELSVLILPDLNEAMAFPPLFSHPTKTAGMVCHHVDEPDAILAQNDYATVIGNSWFLEMEADACTFGIIGGYEEGASSIMQRHWMEVYSFPAVFEGKEDTSKFQQWQKVQHGLYLTSHLRLG